MNIWNLPFIVIVALSITIKLSIVENQSPLYSVWFSVASLFGQGVEGFPNSLSSKIISASWWMFVLLMVSSYTANLAAFLTVSNIDKTINSVEDLISQSVFKYGTYKNGFNVDILKQSKIENHNKLIENIEKLETWAPPGPAAIDKVLNENYALMTDEQSLPIDERKCLIEVVGEPLNIVYHGIGFQKSKEKMKIIILLNFLKCRFFSEDKI